MRRSTILAWSLALFFTASASVLVVLLLRQDETPGVLPTLARLLWNWALPVVFALTGALILTRQPGNRIGWLLMLPVPAILYGSLSVLFLAEPRSALTPALWLGLWIDTWSWILIIFPTLLIPLYFPDGRPPTPRWRWVAWLALIMSLSMLFIAAFTVQVGPMDYDWRLTNPVGFLSEDLFAGIFGILWATVGLLGVTIGSVSSLVVRYRRAGLVEREQIKWLLYATVLLGLSYGLIVLLNTGSEEWISGSLTTLLLSLSMLFIPIAITIAILRYRLFDIDVIIRKTVLYGALTALLAAIYFGAVFLLSALLRNVSGGESPLVLVISTLLIAALFMPLRRRLQAAIDRRFYRRQYDAQQVLGAFAQTAREETDLDQLADRLLTVLQETMEPQTISLWTAESRRALPGRAQEG